MLRIKEQETRLTLKENDDDDDILRHSMSDCQPLQRYEHFTAQDTLPYQFICASLFPRRLTLPPRTPQYHCTVFVNMTLAIQLAVRMPRVGQQVTEYCGHHYPNSWIGRCGQQARPAKSPDLTPP